MPEKTADNPLPVKRLCSEIQLFDLCEKESCSFRDGRFCTDPAMLARFEAVSEPEDRQYLDDEMEDLDEDDLAFGEGYDDADVDEEEDM